MKNVKYVILGLLMAIAVLVYLVPVPVNESFTDQQLKYGKMPKNFAYDVRKDYKNKGVTIMNVTCYGVAASAKYEGWLSVCSYKQKGAGGVWHIKTDSFVINYRRSSVENVK